VFLNFNLSKGEWNWDLLAKNWFWFVGWLVWYC